MGSDRRNIPAMMATVVVVSVPLIVLFWFSGGASWKAFRERGTQGMRTRGIYHPAGRMLSLCLAGSADCPRVRRTEAVATDGERTSFSVPESFDEAREYEIVFWAKNDTNIRQANIYKRAVSEFEALYPNIHVKLSCTPITGRYTTMSLPISPPEPRRISAYLTRITSQPT